MTPAVGIVGYSGSGKTTLIERLLPRLSSRGLRIAVVKHDAHRLVLDRAGKDTARLFDAGAAVLCAHDPTQAFIRLRTAGPTPLDEALAALPVDIDLAIVEGHKDAQIPKIVLEHPDDQPSIDGPTVLATLPWSSDRLEIAEPLILSWLAETHRGRPLGVGLLRTPRRDFAERPLASAASSLAAQVERLAAITERLILVGGGETLAPTVPAVESLPMVRGLREPMGAVIALLRHEPHHAWVLLDPHERGNGERYVEWIRGQRRPGVWMVVPRQAVEASLPEKGVLYEPHVAPLLERSLLRGEVDLDVATERAPKAFPAIPSFLEYGTRPLVRGGSAADADP